MPELDIESLGMMGWGLETAKKFFAVVVVLAAVVVAALTPQMKPQMTP